MSAWKHTIEDYAQLLRFTDPEHLEAPDRRFVGHRDILTRNLARYLFVEPFVHGRTLDLGCGRGYGFDILKQQTEACFGVDISKSFLQSMQLEYPNVPALLASGSAIPFADHSFDTIVSFEVIEHIPDDLGFLYDVRRIARPGAHIIISTPNRLVASGNLKQPINKFHVREYTATEFSNLLCQVFRNVTVYGQSEGSSGGVGNTIIDRIPVQWKYLLPIQFQGIVSVLMRQPLRIEDCHFNSSRFDNAHSLIAVCQL